MKTVKLNNGVDMPMEGFGVFQIPEESCEQAVRTALRSGYRGVQFLAGSAAGSVL